MMDLNLLPVVQLVVITSAVQGIGAIKHILSRIDNYEKVGGPGVVRPSFSLYHHPLWYLHLYLVKYADHIHKFEASNSFSESMCTYLISKPYNFK